ncbi:MAG: hypothetical protein OXF89_18230 [Rhodospirillaceae bacterium]|nr:hypothetical protein [Rhodospirillaceae bacterium]MCY4065087.1 hypothetical protein [Rhodospirillaceae bacterium]
MYSDPPRRSLFVVWQDTASRLWHPVGRLTRQEDEYLFEYTNGAKNSPRFAPFAGMREIDCIYRSDTLFPLFANRIIATSRPEYPKVMRWLGFDEEWTDGFEVLARSGGQRRTDTLRLVPGPLRTAADRYEVMFFGHGIRYLSEDDRARLLTLESGERLFPMHDCQNPADSSAVLLRTGDPMSFTGYCPRYLAEDFLKLLESSTDAKDVEISIVRVNRDAPPQMQLLCKVQAPWPHGFEPFSGEEFQPIEADSSSAIETQVAAVL